MFIFVITPIIGMSFPALTPLIFAAAGALGYKTMSDMKPGGDINEALRQRLYEDVTLRVRVDDLVLESMTQELKRAESLFFEKDGIVLAVMKDERGKLKIEATGPKGTDEKDLQKAGRDFAEELSQMFAYNRAIAEAEKLGAEVVEEVNTEQDEIVLKVRRWT
ncbi:hypothetical protein BH09SUM1_BH09SUM1_07670 [soil metagenome]